jgi:hypothetical protein
MKPAQKGTQKSAKSTTATSKRFKGFTEEEHGAMKDRIQELRADKADGEGLVLAKIAEMPEPDRTIGKRLHAIIKESAPALSPRLWYATFGFSDKANLDEGAMWPTAFALKGLTAAEEARIAALVKKAVS